MNANIKIYNTPELLAESFAVFLTKKVSEKERYNIALSGGSTPEIIFEVLAKNFSDKINWSKVHFFWGDERCVAPDSDESNYKMAKQTLFDKINISKDNIHRIRGESKPIGEAIRYSDEILINLPVENNIPCFDLIMLGLGEDGHTASIFPDRPDLFQSKKICESVKHPLTHQDRITITGPVINNARCAAFFVTGKNKSIIVKKIIKRLPESNMLPASKVNLSNNNLQWYLDSASSSDL